MDKTLEGGKRPYLIPEVAAELRICNSAAYAAVKRGEIPSFSVGRSKRVPHNYKEIMAQSAVQMAE